jgi:hypothetical protein
LLPYGVVLTLIGHELIVTRSVSEGG